MARHSSGHHPFDAALVYSPLAMAWQFRKSCAHHPSAGGLGVSEHISVVIPNWNGERWLPTCLDSLRAQTYTDFRVYVVDNGSIDGSVALMRRDYPEVSIVESAENLGFAGGMNLGFDAARGDILVALNNDVETDPAWLETLAKAMDSRPDIGLAASQLMDFRDRDVIDSVGDWFAPIGLSRKAGAGKRAAGIGDDLMPVQSPCAAASAYRREVLEDISAFDTDFFAYMEDVDLGLRAQIAGYDCAFVPGALVYHIGSATSGGTASAFSIRLTVRNTYQVMLKNLPAPLLPVWIPLTFGMHMAALTLSFLPMSPRWLARNRAALVQGLGAALQEAPRSMRKRRRSRPIRRRGTIAFLQNYWQTRMFHRSI
ncbi:glycosyltransferase family 2 protein [Aquicoccus sp. G2-2]|uniref:glycosyltransferase family 2 protein n=1 Tax=Aquicoccus sp. G2-2 TaxID=3092120 RepID=UPI002AE01769|nr:glycosyltransferase family 2 protein [Aquicoccus sp. G2-2]MEA1114613.1 glycosyltransferase family 2 protein [Aquicoccus sp. G2-2]